MQRLISSWLPALLCSMVLLPGCAVVGPKSISNGRLAYNEAISYTNDQQMLLVILRNRYEERGSLLAVASVTANVRVSSSIGLEAGIGDSDNYQGNLVPFSGGTTYEENPTISYVPVEGEKYLKQVTTPLPVTTVAQMASSMVDPQPYLVALIASVNGIYNPQYEVGDDPIDPRFEQFVALMSNLIKSRRLHWATDNADNGEFSVILDRADPHQRENVDSLLTLLGLPRAADGQKIVAIPVSLALHGREAGGIGITTRAVLQLAEVLSAAVDVPPEHQSEGIALDYPPLGLLGKDLRIRSAETRPEHASVAVRYRDYWFFIDDRDIETKRFFKLVTALWSSTMAESTVSNAPMLTLPVSR